MRAYFDQILPVKPQQGDRVCFLHLLSRLVLIATGVLFRS